MGYAPESDNVWYLRLLGTITAERAGQVVFLSPRKYTALLAFLALHPGAAFSREELIDRFWQDSDFDKGRAALRSALSALRKSFGADLFADDAADIVRLRASATYTDVARFELLLKEARAATGPEAESKLLQQADALYLGPLLPGIYDDALGEYREQLEAQHQQMRERLAEVESLLHRTRAQPPSGKTRGPQLFSLPFFANRYFGRESERDALEQLLAEPQARLVTLTGVGGIGKTRLAVETAHRVVPRFSGAVCFVPLADISDGALLPLALAQALRTGPTPETEPMDQMVRLLADIGPSLLVIDNIEHLLDRGAPQQIGALLARLPDLTVLATSRAPLGIGGEREFPVAPLPASDSIALFVDQARAIVPEFAETHVPNGEEADPSLTALCERLEGIPLAIELCTPWVRVLSTGEILERLERRFELLTTRRRDVPDRHSSLHAALESSLPAEPELRAFFLSLCVFRGGFTRDAVQSVGGAEALSHITSLCERSLLIREPHRGGETRYRFLETVREFAQERIETEARRAAASRHLTFYEARARQETSLLLGWDAARYFARLDQEVPNFRAAIEFGLNDSPENLLLAHRLIEHISWFRRIRGHIMPENLWRERIFARRDELPPLDQAWLLCNMADNADSDAARDSMLDEAMSIFEAGAEHGGIAAVWQRRGDACFQRQDLEGVSRCFRQAAAVQEEAGDLRGAGYSLAELAGRLIQHGQRDEARTLWRRCREISQQLDDPGSLAVLDRAEGRTLIDEGHVEDGLALLERALAIFRRKDETWQIMDTLVRIAETHRTGGDLPRAEQAAREALLLSVRCGDFGRGDVLRAFLGEIAPAS